MILLLYTYACIYMCVCVYICLPLQSLAFSHLGFGPALFQYGLIFTNCICKTQFPNEVTFWVPGHWDLEILIWGEEAQFHPCRQECMILSTKSALHFLGHLHCVQTSKWHRRKWNKKQKNKPTSQQTNQLVPAAGLTCLFCVKESECVLHRAKTCLLFMQPVPPLQQPIHKTH